MILVCPKPITCLHKFQLADRMYVADLSQYLVLEIDNIVWEVLDLCPAFSSEKIIEKLGKSLVYVDEAGLVLKVSSVIPMRRAVNVFSV